MEIIQPDEAGIRRAAEVLRAGGIVVHPTETCYGIACDLLRIDAVRRLFAVKRRPPDQPVSCLFPAVDAAKQTVEWSDKAQELADEHLPGPLTIVLPLRQEQIGVIFPAPEGEGRTLGVRVSPHPVASALAAACPFPISTTSANVHGQPNPYSVEDIAAQFASMPDLPDLILDGGTLPASPPSTVIVLKEKGDITLARKGGASLQ